MRFLKLDYVFAPLSVSLCLSLSLSMRLSPPSLSFSLSLLRKLEEVELEILFSTYFIIGLTPFYLNKKDRK